MPIKKNNTNSKNPTTKKKQPVKKNTQKDTQKDTQKNSEPTTIQNTILNDDILFQDEGVQNEIHTMEHKVDSSSKEKKNGFIMDNVYTMTNEEKESIFNEYDKFKKKIEDFKKTLETNDSENDDINILHLFEKKQDNSPSIFSTIEFDETKKSSIIPHLMKKNIKELESIEESFIEKMNNNLKLLRLFNFIKFLKNTLGDSELYKMYEKSGNNFDFFNTIKMPVKKMAFIFEDDKEFNFHTEFDNYRDMGNDIVSIHFKMMLNKKLIKLNERTKILECIDDFEKHYEEYDDTMKDKKFRSFVNKVYKYNSIDSNMEENIINQIIFRNTLETGKMEILQRLKNIDTDNFDKDQFKKDLQELQKINELQKYGEKIFDDTTDIFDEKDDET